MLKNSVIGSERGVAMLECSIILPLLAMMVVATYDLGGALNEYLMLTRASYEGARYAAVIPGFEGKDTEVTARVTGQSFSGTENHKMVHERVQKILTTSGFSTDHIIITTQNDYNQTVRVTVRKPYQGHFGLFPELMLTVSAAGPFLSKPPV